MRRLPGLRPHHRPRSRLGDPRHRAHAARRSHQARGRRRPPPRSAASSTPSAAAARSRSTCRWRISTTAERRLVEDGDDRFLRDSRLVPLARAQDLQDARPRPAVALPLVSHLPGVRGQPASSPTRSISGSTDARSPTSNRMNVGDAHAFFLRPRGGSPSGIRPRRSCSGRSARASRTCSRWVSGTSPSTASRGRSRAASSSGSTSRRRSARRSVNTLYVLDEPSIGLHPRDSARLVGIMRNLCARQNTVVVVEHDPEIIAAADHVIDMGPGAGAAGGTVVARPARSRTSSPTRTRSRAAICLGGAAFHAETAARSEPPRSRSPSGTRAPTTSAASTSRSRSPAWCASPASRARARARWSRRSCTAGCCAGRGLSTAPPGALRRDRRRREDRRGDLRRPGADRLDPARQRRDLHQDVRRRAPALRGDRARPLARLLGRDVLLQRRRRPLRDLSRRRLRAGRDAVPLRRAAGLPGLQRPPLRSRRPRGTLPRSARSPTSSS